MSIYGLQSWQILQQKNGYADLELVYEATGWLRNPVIPEEIRVSALLKRVRARIFEEETGREVISWVYGTDLKDYKSYCKIKNIPVGGLYTLQFQPVFQNEDGTTFSYPGEMIKHFGVGDNFLIAGQSNADGSAYGPYNEEMMIGVHSYRGGKWDLASHPLGGAGVSPFLSFAKYLKKRLGYPIGLIPRAVGGSPISTWVKGGVYTERLRDEVNDGLGDIKAILWYQGCTDAEKMETAVIYENEFMNYRNEMKKMFGDIPIITFQLNRLRNEMIEQEEGYNILRETQRQIALKNEDCYIIPTIDLTNMSDHIHNGCSDSMLLGQRAASFVLDKVYNKEKNYQAPVLKSVSVNENKVRLEFDNVVESLTYLPAKKELFPVIITDVNGVKIIDNFIIEKNVVTLVLNEELDKDARISINSGIDPKSIIFDNVSKQPVICVYNFKI